MTVVKHSESLNRVLVVVSWNLTMGVSKCPFWKTAPNYWRSNLQQRLKSNVQNLPRGTIKWCSRRAQELLSCSKSACENHHVPCSTINIAKILINLCFLFFLNILRTQGFLGFQVWQCHAWAAKACCRVAARCIPTARAATTACVLQGRTGTDPSKAGGNGGE